MKYNPNTKTIKIGLIIIIFAPSIINNFASYTTL